MSFNKTSATEKAKRDLAKRAGVSEGDVEMISVEETDFPDMSLGATAAGEMAAQMISTGWRINLRAGGKNYEYRADKYQLRLCNYKGANHIVE
jgi:hypothetical protein